MMASSIFYCALSEAKGRKSIHLQNTRLELIRAYIEEAATKEGLEPALVRAIVKVESNFNHRATSRVGAKGLMQIMPYTANELGSRKALDHSDPRSNIMAGAKYIRELINEFEGRLPLAIAAYNAGPSAVKKYHGIPPYQETRNYVVRVLKELENERKLLISLND